MNERREISFVLTVEDVVAFNVVGHRRLPFGQRNLSRFLLGGAILLSIFLLFTMALDRGDEPPLFVLFGPSIPFLVVLGLWAHPWRVPRRVRAQLAQPQNRHILGEKTLSIGPEGITLQSPDAQSLFHWDMIEEIEETDDHVFFFYAQRTALVLPRRPFPSEDAFEDFMNLARRYHEGSESVNGLQLESFTPRPTSDEFASRTRRASEPPTVLRVDEERTAAGRDLSFVLTVEDHIAFNNLLHQRLPFWRRYLLLLTMFIALPTAGFMVFSTARDPGVSNAETLLIIVLVLVALLPVTAVLSVFMMRHQAAKRARAVRKLLAHPQNQKFVSEMTISITPEEVIERSMRGTTTMRWEKIREIVVTADHAFFFYAERAALTIPKRPRQAEEFEEFVDLARQYHEGNLPCEETV